MSAVTDGVRKLPEATSYVLHRSMHRGPALRFGLLSSHQARLTTTPVGGGYGLIPA